MTSSDARSSRLLACVALAAAALAFLAGRGGEAQHSVAAYDAIPRGTSLVVLLDVRKLREAGLGEIAGSDVGALGPIGCGKELAAGVCELAIALAASPGGEDAPPDFGVVATGELPAARLLACARRTIEKRGGAAVVTRIGSFDTVRDARRPGEAGEIAVREGGPLLLGGGAWLRGMIDAADGRVPAHSGDPLHAALRRSLAPKAAAVATWTPPPGWLARFADLGDHKTPLDDLRAAALGVEVAPRVAVHAVLGFGEAASASSVAKMLGHWKGGGEALIVARSLGFPLLERLRASARERELHVELDLAKDEAERIAERLLGAMSAPPAGAPGSPPGPLQRPSAQPDEIVPAPR